MVCPRSMSPSRKRRRLAAVWGAAPLIGRAATNNSVLRAIAGSHRIHIATHGMHNYSAPAFQSLYVNPEQGSDGIIYAYELLRVDLSGVGLVTLSARETALGRFDIADDLRGIPAALLAAGVITIVGTLWQVESACAARFFVLFYQQLHDHNVKLEAFWHAQRQTRLEYPEYWQWGAFQYIGGWALNRHIAS
jgi:CHAT domain-containing protein